MRPDSLLGTLDRWGRAALPGAVLLLFVLLTLAPLRAPYLSDALPLLPALVVFQYSLAMPERLPGPFLVVLGVLLDLLLGGPGAPIGISALGFVLIRAAVVANRRYLVGVPFLFQWFGFCLLALCYVLLVWIFTGAMDLDCDRSGAGDGAVCGGGRALPADRAAIGARAGARPAQRARAVPRCRSARGDGAMMRFRKDDGARSGLFTRRALLLGGAQALLLSALVGRLYQLQVVDTRRFSTLAEENRINLRLLPPSRGLIFDRTGQPLAINRNNFRAMATSDRGHGAELLVDRLDQILNLGEGEKARLLRELRRSRTAQPLVVRENLGWEEVARIEFNAPDLPGVFIDLGQTRDYPEGELMSHIVGYTGPRLRRGSCRA